MSPTPSVSRGRFFLRLACTLLTAMVFLFWCGLQSESVYSEGRMLAGPVSLLRTRSIDDKVIGMVGVMVLLMGIFAVGLRKNTVTVLLSILAILCWIACGLWIEAIASV